MRPFFRWFLPVCALSLASGARAQEPPNHPVTPAPQLRAGDPVAVVGPISRAWDEQTMTLGAALGPEMRPYYFHLTEETSVLDPARQPLDVERIEPGTWVHAEGTLLEAPGAIRITRLHVLGTEEQARATPYFRAEHPHGYLAHAVTEPPVVQPPVAPPTQIGDPLVVVGRVTADTGPLRDTRRLRVEAAGQEWRIWVPHEAAITDPQAQEISVHDVREGAWVRAEGWRTEERELDARALHLIAQAGPEADLQYRQSAFFQPGQEQGYVFQVAGVREELLPDPSPPFVQTQPLVLVGRVTADTGPLRLTRRLRVDVAGQEWRLSVIPDAAVFDHLGREASVHDIDEGDWIRAEGWHTDERRMRVLSLRRIAPEGPDAEAIFRASPHFRAGFERGYVARVAGVREVFQPVQISGIVIRIDQEDEWFMLRTPDMREIIVYTDGARFTRAGQPFPFAGLQVGDQVSVAGRTVGPFNAGDPWRMPRY